MRRCRGKFASADRGLSICTLDLLLQIVHKDRQDQVLLADRDQWIRRSNLIQQIVGDDRQLTIGAADRSLRSANNSYKRWFAGRTK